MCPQHDLTLMMRNFSEIVLRPQRDLGYAEGKDIVIESLGAAAHWR